jgi:hypothetical protein
MEASRSRVESILEWAVAAIFVLGVIAVGTVAIREFRTVSAVMPALAREAATPPAARPAPAAVPPRAVSVPILLLSDGLAVRVGESLSLIVERLGRASEAGQAIERAPYGERLTRLYEYAGSKFVLVFEPFQRDAEPRVAAIYLQ